MDEIIGSVKKIIFRNEDNSYTVLELALESGEFLTVVGVFPTINVGETLEATGKFSNHRDYGRQFNVEYFEIYPPCTEDAIVDYLSGGAIKGLKRETAKQIVARFGMETLNILEKDADKLTEVRGISKDKAHTAGRKYREISIARNTISALSEVGIKPYIAARVYRIFGVAAIKMIKENPYLLCDEIFEVTFEEADAIAMEIGISYDADCRMRAALEYVLLFNTKNGHTFLPEASLIAVTAGLVGCGEEEIAEVLKQMLTEKVLFAKNIANLNAIYLKKYNDSEELIAGKLLRLSKNSHPALDENVIKSAEKSLKITFADMQREAITTAARCGLFILTGGPGTGKTTTLNGIIYSFKAQGKSVLLAAPTGRAAKRMTDVTGVEAYTIHRLLETGFDSAHRPHFAKNEKNKIEADVLVIDEASMVDTLVFDALLRALKDETQLILVGDIDQLPPVGAGAVLSDILKAEMFPCVRLNEVFRQAQDSLIVVNAHTVNEGKYPNCDSIDSDFYFVKRQDKNDILTAIGMLAARSLPKKFGFDPINDVQVLSPTRKNELGTKAINGMMRELLNPPSPHKKEYLYLDNLFREGDKVMQIRNNYDVDWVNAETGEVGIGIYNGDIGRIKSIDTHNKVMTIDFDGRIASILFDNLFDLEPAYAITVHKSQGNEFPCVVMPITFESGKLATRNLVYTAITRAKTVMVMVGIPEALYKMVDNNKELKRFSGLKYILRRIVEEGIA